MIPDECIASTIQMFREWESTIRVHCSLCGRDIPYADIFTTSAHGDGCEMLKEKD